MERIEYRILQANECDRINEIDPTQYIKNAWRLVDGKRKLVEIDYLENDWPDGYGNYRNKRLYLFRMSIAGLVLVRNYLCYVVSRVVNGKLIRFMFVQVQQRIQLLFIILWVV
jgi:hypothetical protein